MQVGGWLILQVVSECGDQDEEQHRTVTQTQHYRNCLDPVDPPTSSPPTSEPLVLYKQYPSSTDVILGVWTRLTVNTKTTGNQTSQ